MKIVAYRIVDSSDLPADMHCIAHCFEETTWKSGPKKGQPRLVFLPATKFHADATVAEKELWAFLNEQIAKAAARKEHGRKLGQSRRKET